MGLLQCVTFRLLVPGIRWYSCPVNFNDERRHILDCPTGALLAGACGSGGSSAGGSGGDRVHQMHTWVSTENDRAQWQSFVDAAKEKDPNFTLTFDGPSFNDYWTKVKTRMVGSDAPCILTTQAARAQELSGLLEPLDSYMEAAGIHASDYNAAMMQGMMVDGKVLALPYDAEPDVLYYNREMFEKAGLSEPTTSYTAEQFLKDAKALTPGAACSWDG